VPTFADANTERQKMKEKIPVTLVLDTFGLLCPMPIIKTAARIKKMQQGEVLKVLSDDPGILEDMPAWCVTSGNELITIEESDGEFHAYVRKLR
jgi:tRNA 2-thiouridine synthesizing protein A